LQAGGSGFESHLLHSGYLVRAARPGPGRVAQGESGALTKLASRVRFLPWPSWGSDQLVVGTVLIRRMRRVRFSGAPLKFRKRYWLRTGLPCQRSGFESRPELSRRSSSTARTAGSYPARSGFESQGRHQADEAHLAEHSPGTGEVAGSNLVVGSASGRPRGAAATFCVLASQGNPL
jgi:hypothetical protein